MATRSPNSSAAAARRASIRRAAGGHHRHLQGRRQGTAPTWAGSARPPPGRGAGQRVRADRAAFDQPGLGEPPWPDARTVAFGITVPSKPSAISWCSTRCGAPGGQPSPWTTRTCSRTSARSPGWKAAGIAPRGPPVLTGGGPQLRESRSGWPRVTRGRRRHGAEVPGPGSHGRAPGRRAGRRGRQACGWRASAGAGIPGAAQSAGADRWWGACRVALTRAQCWRNWASWRESASWASPPGQPRISCARVSRPLRGSWAPRAPAESAGGESPCPGRGGGSCPARGDRR